MASLGEIREANAFSARLGREKTWHPDVLVALHKAHEAGHIGEQELKPLFAGVNALPHGQRQGVMASAARLLSQRGTFRGEAAFQHLIQHVPMLRPAEQPGVGEIRGADAALQVLHQKGASGRTIGILAKYPELALLVAKGLKQGEIEAHAADVTGEIVLHAEAEHRGESHADNRNRLAKSFDRIHKIDGAFDAFYPIVIAQVREKLGAEKRSRAAPRRQTPAARSATPAPSRATPLPPVSRTLSAATTRAVPGDTLEPLPWVQVATTSRQREPTPAPQPSDESDRLEEELFGKMPPEKAAKLRESMLDKIAQLPLPRGSIVIKHTDLHPDVKDEVNAVLEERIIRREATAIPLLPLAATGALFADRYANAIHHQAHLNTAAKLGLAVGVGAGIVGLVMRKATSFRVRETTKTAFSVAASTGSFDSAGVHKPGKLSETHPMGIINRKGDVILLPATGVQRFLKRWQSLPIFRQLAPGRHRVELANNF